MAMPSVDHDELGLRACDGVKPNMHRGSEVSFAFRLQPAYIYGLKTPGRPIEMCAKTESSVQTARRAAPRLQTMNTDKD